MSEIDFAEGLEPAFVEVLRARGFTALTPVQKAVLDPALAGRDLRVSSQTGSGKTVAIGLALRDHLAPEADEPAGVARPRALIVTPTRELAKQVEEELRWLFAKVDARVVSVTGGASYRDERRALASRPAIVVGTPGRLLDHLERGMIDGAAVRGVVLDEADRMLDLGFRDELEAILEHAPPGHRTHLVSATFPRDVKALADRVQSDPAHVEGTRLGAAHEDIEHVVHLVHSGDRMAAIVNLLLAHPEDQTLVFARTRADVAHVASELAQAGFGVSSLSGEMEQPERTRAMAAFRRGDLRVLVATDVAARGIDVQDIARVIHAEPPNDADTYTHRSGRTGRAGRKGTSAMLVTRDVLARTSHLLGRAKVTFRIEPLPSADALRRAADERLLAELSAEADGEAVDARTSAIAERLAASPDAKRIIERLLARSRRAGPEPRDVRPIVPPAPRSERTRTRPAHVERARAEHPVRARPDGAHAERARPEHAERARPEGPAPRREKGTDFVPFHVSWGGLHGADARRLLALVCRRGDIRGDEVGAIHVERTFSVVEVARDVAEAFATAARRPDPRDPRVLIRPDLAGADAPVRRAAPRATPSRPSAARGKRPPPKRR